MKRLIYFLIFFFVLAAESVAGEIAARIKALPDNGMDVIFYENQKEIARWTYDKDGKVVSKTGTVPNGIVETYSADRLVTSAQFKDSELNGESRDYYFNGNLRSKSRYKNGQLDGKLIVYYDGGGVHYVRYYKNGVSCGMMKEYWSSGKLKSRIRFENGKVVVLERFDRTGKFFNKKVLMDGEALSPLELP